MLDLARVQIPHAYNGCFSRVAVLAMFTKLVALTIIPLMDKWRKHTHELEEDPATQIIFHKRMMRVWAINAPFVVVIYSLSFIFPRYAVQVAAFLGMYTAMVSLYANWVSDFDGVSAAQSTLATIKQSQTVDSDLQDIILAVE